MKGLGGSAEEDRASALTPGVVLDGRYAVGATLGEGGMAEVHEADDLVLQRKVAVKVPRRRELAASLLREARALAAIRHPGTVVIHDVGSFGTTPYLVLERVYGVRLDLQFQARLRDGRPFEVIEVVDLLILVASALDAAHAAGVSHRDIKPANLIVVSPRRIVLVDFGLVHLHCDADEQLGGSPEYMAPEVVLGHVRPGEGPQVDLYALGVVAYELLVGAPPFVDPHFTGVLLHQIGDEPARVRHLRHDVPDALDALVAALLHKDPKERPEAAEQVVWELQRIRRNLGGVATRRSGGVGGARRGGEG